MEGMSSRYVQQIVPLRLQSRDCVFPNPLPISHKNPQAQQQYGSIMGSHCFRYSPVACKEELKLCNVCGKTHSDALTWYVTF